MGYLGRQQGTYPRDVAHALRASEDAQEAMVRDRTETLDHQDMVTRSGVPAW